MFPSPHILHLLPILFSLVLSRPPVCSALSLEVFADGWCSDSTPWKFGPLLPGYCYPYIEYGFTSMGSRRFIPSFKADCNQDGTIRYTTYTDTECTNLLEDSTGTPNTCSPVWFPHNQTRSYTNIRISCPSTLLVPPHIPGPYMNVSAIYYPSSSTCNVSSPFYEIPSAPHGACVDVRGNSFKIDCWGNDADMSIYQGTGCNSKQIIVHVKRPYNTDKTKLINNKTTCASEDATPRRSISAQIDCETAPNNGQPMRYPASNRTYIVTGIHYHRATNLANKIACDDQGWGSFPSSFGPFQSGTCQIFADGRASYMVTCSHDGQGRINVFQNTTTCDTNNFFSFAQGAADGRTCLSFSMSNGGTTFLDEGTKILCKPTSQFNQASALYHQTYTYMLLLMALVICINTFASI